MTIVLDESSAALAPQLEAWTRVVLFRRSQGWDGDVVQATEELHRLLSVEARGPAAFVASSMGAFTAFSLARRYPGDVQALVLLDPSHPNQGTSALRILDAHPLPPSTEVDDLRRFFRSSNEASRTGAAELALVGSLGDLPLLVLAAGALAFPPVLPRTVQDLLIADRHQMLAGYTTLSQRGRFQVVPGVGHGLAAEAPETVAGLVRDFLERISP